MQTEQIKISKLKENTGQVEGLPTNPRLIKDDKFKKLVKSIQDDPEMLDIRELIVFPFQGDYIVIGGNMRLKAMKELKYKEAPCKVLPDETPIEKLKAYLIKDNVGYGEMDWDSIANEDWNLETLSEWGLDIPDFGEKLEAEEDDFEVPNANTIETDIVLGDLFEIGPHRLLCGSSTDADDVAKLMGGGFANLMITDPPYGVKLDQTWRNGVGSQNHNGNKNVVANDDIADWTDAYSLFTGTIAYVWHATKFTDVIMKNLRDCKFEPNQMLILNKSVMVMGRSDYHWKHEPCWYAVKKGATHSWIGDRKQVTVIDAVMPSARAQKSDEDRTEHPTQKPIACMSIPMQNHSGDVYEPFCGSGTTVVSGHQLKRKVYAMELMPQYCQITIDRMLKLDPNIEIKKNGEPYKRLETI